VLDIGPAGGDEACPERRATIPSADEVMRSQWVEREKARLRALQIQTTWLDGVDERKNKGEAGDGGVSPDVQAQTHMHGTLDTLYAGMHGRYCS
jgi:hypothetical protein